MPAPPELSEPAIVRAIGDVATVQLPGVKDRQKNQGREMPFGEGDTPLKEVLLLVRDQKYDFPVCIEYVGPDGPVAELTRCFDYCKAVLQS